MNEASASQAAPKRRPAKTSRPITHQDPVAGGLPGAVKAALPARLTPQLATLVQAPPEGDWSFELKFDGYRILARIQKGEAQLFTRNGHDWTAKLAAQARAMEALHLEDGWIDGEIVVAGPNGVPDFQALQNAFDTRATEPIRFFAFDLPYYGGYDLRAVPLTGRRALLHSLIPHDKGALVQFSESIADSGDVLAAACRIGMEGVIGKRNDSPYASGRSKAWIKLKCENRQEFVVGGYTDPQRTRTGFGALLLGVYEDGKLRYAGRTGTGFDEAQLKQLQRRLSALETRRPPFESPPTGADARGVHWVRPQLVAEVSFAQWTQEGIVRQAVFHGLRTDKPASSVTLEKAAAVPRARTSKPAAGSHGVRGSGRPRPRDVRSMVGDVSISHPERVIDPASGLTKLDVARYYHAIAPALLPHLHDRPVALVRLPDGLQGEKFFQKHLGKGQIPQARSLDPALDPGHAPLVALETPAALLGAAQMGVVELHTWNAVASRIVRPDRIVFDLDPDPALPWARVLEAAELTHALLAELGLRCFAKTSGSKGLHIAVPLRRSHDWDTARRFSKSVADHLAVTLPRHFSAKMGAANRVGKVFIDYLRNNRGSTTVSAFSLRARPGLPVSVPVGWEELVELRKPDQWTLSNIQDRLSDLPEDPWSDYEKSRQTLTKAAALLSPAEPRRTQKKSKGR
jgi:bifunctional non-homologous end joining protein LigD